MRNGFLRLLLCLLVLAAEAYAENARIPLLRAIEVLKENGYQVVYSSSLVTSAQSIAVDQISISTLRGALPALGLELKQVNDLWVISKITSGSVSGQIVSPQGKPINNAYIKTQDATSEVTSGKQGFFEISGISASTPIIIGAIGFEEKTVPAGTFSSGQRELGRIVLKPTNVVENVIVTGSLYRFPYRRAGESSFQMSADEINSTPNMAGDSMRVVNRLPGVSSVGVSAKPRIRGGLQDEVLILLDGVELLEPFHLSDYQAGYSSIDNRTVDSIDIYTGGFPVRYGNRMSGVIDVKTNRAESPFNTEIGLSNFSTFINARGQTEGSRGLDWLVSARRGDLEELTQFIDSLATDPRYSDASARVSVEFSDRVEWSAGGLVTNDNIRFQDEEESALSRVANNYFWSRLDVRHSKYFYNSLIFSYANINREKRQSSFEEEEKGGFLDYSQDVHQFNLRNDYRFSRGENLIEFGFQAAYGQSDYKYRAAFDRGLLAQLLDNRQLIDEDIQLKPKGWLGGAYLAAELAIAKLLVQPSIRWDTQRYYFSGQSQQLSPRLGLAYDVTDDFSLRFSIGRFHQPEGLHELQVIDGEQRFFKPQSSDQVVLGLDWQHKDLTIKTEFYYKRYRNLKVRFENAFNPFVLLPEMEPDRIRLNPEKALARGVDIELKYPFGSSLQGVLRYSHMSVEDRIEGFWVPRRWSQSNAINAQISWQRNNFSLAAAVTWHSGWRTSMLQNAIPVETQIPLETVLNNTELREYFSLDISASKSWRLGKTLMTVHADITNVTERNNLAGIDFDIEEEDGEMTLVPDGETLLPLISSIGVIISF